MEWDLFIFGCGSDISRNIDQVHTTHDQLWMAVGCTLLFFDVCCYNCFFASHFVVSHFEGWWYLMILSWGLLRLLLVICLARKRAVYSRRALNAPWLIHVECSKVQRLFSWLEMMNSNFLLYIPLDIPTFSHWLVLFIHAHQSWPDFGMIRDPFFFVLKCLYQKTRSSCCWEK